MTLTLDPPSETQRKFLCAETKYVAFGGARGGGKSWAVRFKAVLLSMHYPGIIIMIVRKTYPELRANHINQLRALTTDVADYREVNKELTFCNRSVILFRYAQNEKDLEKYQGTECDVLFIDEATQLTEEQYDKFKACVRGVNSFPKRIYLTCNPGGVGHQWVKRLFVDRKYKDTEIPAEYTFIKSKVTDNKALMESDPDYVRQLEALPPKLRKAWLDGDWDIFEGQFFEDFADRPEQYMERTWTHVIEPFEVPDGWKIYRSFDWGYAKPFSCGWWAIDYDGVAYRILELYGCRETPNEGVKWTADRVFSEIHRIETEHRWLKGKRIHGVADPAIWDAQYGESIAETAAKHQVFFEKGDHERLPGWMQVHYRLAFDEAGFPMMYIFKTCKAFIRTIPLLCYDAHKPEDVDTDGEDHVADETRYFCMARPIKPRMAPPPDTYKESPMYQYLDIPKEDIIAKPRRKRVEVISKDA
jgi:hypothetical protein